ncbi:leucine-rich repeat-containing protein 15-like [Aphidius gifuensis]|uniref:leucine-rich repeat-containing protein 15-like n=1 Tax=Aphidius gifuensis TaxID=684658 RepID=UPI001CDC4629|nr:leucine-rich repeat-containing protein 15-like [Aphidius gifuensis]
MIIVNLQVISSSIVCTILETVNTVCRTDQGELIPFKAEYLDSRDTSEGIVEYVDNSIDTINDYVFNDPPFYQNTKSLKLRLSNETLFISPNAFHLSNLEHLEITPGSVQLELNIFEDLDNLKSLKLKINETSIELHEILPNFQKLESLELIENDIESICDPSGNALNISSLNYTASHINSLSSGSFKCLPNLKSLVITETNLSLIEVGAFENLKKLETLRLTSNWQLTNISSYFFNESKILEVIDLANNSILKIDRDAFDSINKNCKMLNLSYNLLGYLEFECFKNLECETIDLGGNNIHYIGSNEFENSIILRMFLDDNIIDKFNNKRRWSLKNSTVVYFKFDHDETAANTDKTYSHCYESDQAIYVICKKVKYIVSVKQRVLPYRLLPTSLAIYDNERFGIDPNAFVDLSIETLIIESSADHFGVRQNAFLKNVVNEIVSR